MADQPISQLALAKFKRNIMKNNKNNDCNNLINPKLINFNVNINSIFPNSPNPNFSNNSLDQPKSDLNIDILNRTNVNVLNYNRSNSNF